MGNSQPLPDGISEPTQRSSSSSQAAAHSAAYGGHFEKLKQIKVSKLENLFGKDETGRTPLHYACGRGASQCVEFLLEQSDCRVDEKDLKGLTPLDYACIAVARNTDIKSRAFECAKLLLSAGCELSSLKFMPLDTVATDGRNLIHWAAKSGHTSLLKYLLEKHPKLVKSKDRRGWSPLMCASLCTSDTVGKTLNFLLTFLIEKTSKVEAMDDIFAALAVSVETWNHDAVDVLLSYLGEMASESSKGCYVVCRLFNANAATAASMAAMVSTIASVVATKVATDAGIAFERIRRKRWRKIAKHSLGKGTKKNNTTLTRNIHSITMLDRMHMRRHHDNWLHWILRVSRDVDDHYESALRSNKMYWPEMIPPNNDDEDEGSSLVRFYSHRANIESIPSDVVDDDDDDDDGSSDEGIMEGKSSVGIARGGDALQTTLTLLGLEDKEKAIKENVGSDLRFLHWTIEELMHGERADKTNVKYKALRGILTEDEINVLRKGLRITQDLRTGTSLALGKNRSYRHEEGKFSVFKESIAILRENSTEVNQNSLPPGWNHFQSVIEGLAERFEIVGACQGMFLSNNMGSVVSTSSNKVMLFSEANTQSKLNGYLNTNDHIILQTRSNGFVQVIETQSQSRGWLLSVNVNPAILPRQLTDLLEEKYDTDEGFSRNELGVLVDNLLEIMTVIQEFRYQIYCQELEENILALDHAYFPSNGDPIRVSKLRPLDLDGIESYTWYEKNGHGLALRLNEDSNTKKKMKFKRYHMLDVRHRPIGRSIILEDKDVVKTAQRYVLRPMHRLRYLLSLLGPKWSIHPRVRCKAASLLYMITKSGTSDTTQFKTGDTVIIPADNYDDKGETRRWKVGTILDTKDDENIVREFSKIRVRTEDETEMIRHTSEIVLLQRDKSVENSNKFNTISTTTTTSNNESMCVTCCSTSSSFHEIHDHQSIFLCWRIGRLYGVRMLSELLLSSSESTLNEVTLKLLVNLLRVRSNSSLLPRTSSGQASFASVISRLLDPSATQRASAAEIVKSVLLANVPQHTQNVTQVAQAGLHPLLMLLLKWIRLMEAENNRRRLIRDHMKKNKRSIMETTDTVLSQGCCVPISCSSSSKTSSLSTVRSKSSKNHWHGSDFIRIGEVRDRMRHQAVIANAAAAAVSAISGMLSLTPVESTMKSDMEDLNRVEEELEALFQKHPLEEKKHLEEEEDVKRKKKKEFDFNTDVGSSLRRAFHREKVRNLDTVKSENDLKKRLGQLPSFRASAVSSDFGGVPLESVPSDKLKAYAEEWAHDMDPFRVLQSSVLVAWAVEMDLDHLNDILIDASVLINRFAEIAMCSISLKMTSSGNYSSYTTFSAMQVLMWGLWTSCSDTEQAEEEKQEHEIAMKQLHGSVRAEYDRNTEMWRKARMTIFSHVSKALHKICSVKNVGILLKKVIEESKRSIMMLEYTQILIRSKDHMGGSKNLMAICSWISKKTNSLQTLVRSSRACLKKMQMLHNTLQSSVRIVDGHVTLPLVLSRAVKQDMNEDKGSCVKCLVQFLLNDSEQQTRLLQQQGVSSLLPLRRYVSRDVKVAKLFEQLSILFGTARTALVRVNLCGNVAAKTPHIPSQLSYESIALRLGHTEKSFSSSSSSYRKMRSRNMRPSVTMGSKWIVRLESAEQEQDVLNLLMPSFVEMMMIYSKKVENNDTTTILSVLQSLGWISLRVDSVKSFLKKTEGTEESAIQHISNLVTSQDDRIACAACVVLANLIVTSSVACGSLRKKFKMACKEIIEKSKLWRKGVGPLSLSSIAQFGRSLYSFVVERRSWPGAVRHLAELVSTLSSMPSRTKIGKSATDHNQGQGKADPAKIDTKRLRFLFSHLAPHLGKIKSEQEDADVLLWTSVRTAVFATASAAINQGVMFQNENKNRTIKDLIENNDDERVFELSWRSIDFQRKSSLHSNISSTNSRWNGDTVMMSSSVVARGNEQADEEFIAVHIRGNNEGKMYKNNMSSNTTVHDLRLRIARYENIPVSNVRLYCKGIQLAELGPDIIQRAVDTIKSVNTDENVDVADSIPISIVRESLWLVAATKSYSRSYLDECEVLQIVLQQPPEVGLPTANLLYQVACQKKHKKKLESEGASAIVMDALKVCSDERTRRLLLKTMERLRGGLSK